MIFDRLANAGLYSGVHPLFPRVFTWLREHAATAAIGRHEMGDGAYASIEEYPSHPFRHYETHCRFIDVQVVVSGEEYIYIGVPSEMSEEIPYNGDKDIAFLTQEPNKGIPVAMKAGDLLVIWPHEAHAPGCVKADGASFVRKIVVKVPIKEAR
ncbi:MAG: YhcH/YjgK/YiaL family protein [Kiritimatiellia bacterium]